MVPLLAQRLSFWNSDTGRMARTSRGRLKTPREHAAWSPMEDFVLESLVGKVSYQMIALRLGRSPGAVQRRASYKGLSARKNWAGDRARRAEQLGALEARRLTMSEADLADYL